MNDSHTSHRCLALPMYLALLALLLAGCGGGTDARPADPDAGGAPALTYYRDAKAIIDTRCATCHRDGDIAPFPLTTYEEVQPMTAAMAIAVNAGAMPPWQPGDDCNTYLHDFSLRDQERATLLAWLDSGAVAGDPADHVPRETPPDSFVADLALQIPEPYQPPAGVRDDYRCFVLEWPETAPTYVTGFQVRPDQRGMVHHVILFKAEPADVALVRELDAAEDGPGYTCYGGPLAGGAMGNARLGQLATWVPGQLNALFPAGTGIRVEPGSLLVMQLHYNTDNAEPAPDQTGVAFSLAEQVERPAILQLFTRPAWFQPGGMPIPAGDSDVTHLADMDLDLFLTALELDDDIGLAPGGDLEIHGVGVHMHELGTRGRVAVRRANGTEGCLLDIPDWDFHWQGGYVLAQPFTVAANDRVLLQCWWDNSAANQPDGGEPQYTEWGEGTGDEMCLTALFITAR
jgi:hypothetical protein